MTDIYESDRDRIRRTYRELNQLLKDGHGDEEAREEAADVIEENADRLAWLLEDTGFEEFLEDRLEKWRRETDKAMCSCWRATCPLKRGEIPPKLRQHESPVTVTRDVDALVTEYLQNHSGGEAVRRARREWRQMATQVETDLSEAFAGLHEVNDEF